MRLHLFHFYGIANPKHSRRQEKNSITGICLVMEEWESSIDPHMKSIQLQFPCVKNRKNGVYTHIHIAPIPWYQSLVEVPLLIQSCP